MASGKGRTPAVTQITKKIQYPAPERFWNGRLSKNVLNENLSNNQLKKSQKISKNLVDPWAADSDKLS